MSVVVEGVACGVWSADRACVRVRGGGSGGQRPCGYAWMRSSRRRCAGPQRSKPQGYGSYLARRGQGEARGRGKRREVVEGKNERMEGKGVGGVIVR